MKHVLQQFSALSESPSIPTTTFGFDRELDTIKLLIYDESQGSMVCDAVVVIVVVDWIVVVEELV